MTTKPRKSALNVMEGIEQPGQINPKIVKEITGKRAKLLSVQEYVDGIISGNRTILSQAITLIESSLAAHQQIAQEIISECLNSRDKSVHVTSNASRNAIRIGITGVPGVGKSTFIEALGKHITCLGHKLAVLAIDPTSSRSKGSILGDKTRMEDLANDPDAFIRPSPSGGTLGGVARKTRETIFLCEAAGFDVIFVETVGVGQSETVVHGMVDFFLLLMLAGAGDELQGIKRGIIEMADAIVINKADGDNIGKAQLAKAQYANALHLFPPSDSGWIPRVDTCSAYTRAGIPEVWSQIIEYRAFSETNGYFVKKRMEQNRQVFHESIEAALRSSFYQRNEINHQLRKLETEIVSGKLNPYTAAQELLSSYLHPKK